MDSTIETTSTTIMILSAFSTYSNMILLKYNVFHIRTCCQFYHRKGDGMLQGCAIQLLSWLNPPCIGWLRNHFFWLIGFQRHTDTYIHIYICQVRCQYETQLGK